MHQEKECLWYFVNKNQKINIDKFCKLMTMSRGNFYSRYSSKKKFFLLILENDLRNGLFHVRNKKCGVALEQTLKLIKQNYHLYFWMYQNTTHEEHLYIKKHLRNTLKEIIKKFADEKEGISNKRLNEVTGELYDQFLSLILHHFDESLLDAYGRLRDKVYKIEGHRCFEKIVNK